MKLYTVQYVLAMYYTYVRMYIHTYMHTYIHTYVHTYMHTYIRTYVHTYVHTYMHTYTQPTILFDLILAKSKILPLLFCSLLKIFRAFNFCPVSPATKTF